MKRNARFNELRFAALARERAVASGVLPAAEAMTTSIACPSCAGRNTALVARVDVTERPTLECPCGASFSIRLTKR